jgi:hypothetical protein
MPRETRYSALQTQFGVPQNMTPKDVERFFSRSDDSYFFARWGRPIAPIEDQSIATLKGAIEVTCAMVGHPIAETDPELGTNLMFFFIRDWDELLAVPDLDRIMPNLNDLVGRLQAAASQQYRSFRFDDQGAIKACFVFVRMDKELSKMSADALFLMQVVQSFLVWSDRAFQYQSPLAIAQNGHTVLRAEVADVIRAAYDPVLPVMAQDASHALRLFARLPKDA